MVLPMQSKLSELNYLLTLISKTKFIKFIFYRSNKDLNVANDTIYGGKENQEAKENVKKQIKANTSYRFSKQNEVERSKISFN